MSAATGYIVYTYLKFLIMGQQLVAMFSYDQRTYPRDIMENFSYMSLMFSSVLLNRLWKIIWKIKEFTKGLAR